MISNPILREAIVVKNKQGISLSTETYDYILPDQIIDMNARGVAYKLITNKDSYIPTNTVIINSITKVVRNG
jgi:hypothetical protein